MSVRRKIFGILRGPFGMVPGADGLVSLTGATGSALTITSAAGLTLQPGNGSNIQLGGSANVPNAVGVYSTIQLRSGDQIAWSSGSSTPFAGNDTGMKRVAAGVAAPTNGSTGAGDVSAVANSPAQITSAQNDYSPGTGMFQRWNSDASRNVTGMVAGQEGELRYIWNVGAQNIVLVNASASSAAANRFTNSTGADITLAANKCALAEYDGTTTVWRVTLLP